MKKIFSMIALAAMFSFVACDPETDEEPGGTNIEKMAGVWDVQYDGVDDDGNITMEDPFGAGICTLYTYNTNDNGTAQMWLDDRNTFWAYKFLTNINYGARTFANEAVDYDAAGSGTAIVEDGKILEGAAKNEHGMPTDSISFYITFSDDQYVGRYWTKLHVSGRRHSGFSADTE